MNPMFNEYKDAGKIQEALLIGRNMVNKAPGDSECVNAYLDFLLMLAEKLPRTDERKSFADQANLVLSFYEENADLTDDIINDIHVYHNRLGAVVTDIAQLEQEEYEKQKRAIEATNTTQIKKLYTIKQKLENAKTHAEFDKLLQEISAVDAEIDHDNLTSEQKTHYDQLNKSCTDTISAKMRQLEYKDISTTTKRLLMHTTLLLQVSRIMNRGIKIRASFWALFPRRCLHMMQDGYLMKP